MADLSASVKGGVFMDKQTQKPYKLYSVYDNEGGVEPQLVKVYYSVGKNAITKENEFKKDESVEPILLKDPAQAKQELLLIGDQIVGTSQKQREAQYEPIMDNEDL
jgi:hypothetical protein